MNTLSKRWGVVNVSQSSITPARLRRPLTHVFGSSPRRSPTLPRFSHQFSVADKRQTMAPNAERLRSRKPGNDAVVGDETVGTDEGTRTLDNLKGTEVCIDGIVYDIADFPHPGGESVLIFGGNDVTVQYKMIHPYHTSKHLEKMKQVAVLKDYQAE